MDDGRKLCFGFVPVCTLYHIVYGIGDVALTRNIHKITGLELLSEMNGLGVRNHPHVCVNGALHGDNRVKTHVQQTFNFHRIDRIDAVDHPVEENNECAYDGIRCTCCGYFWSPVGARFQPTGVKGVYHLTKRAKQPLFFFSQKVIFEFD